MAAPVATSATKTSHPPRTAPERAPGDAPVVVLAHHYWTTRFGADPAIVGRGVRVSGRPLTVIGVASERFRGTEALVRIDAYVPAWQVDEFSELRGRSSVLEDRAFRQFSVLGQVQPGVSVEQARAALNVTAASLARDYPVSHTGASLRVVPKPWKPASMRSPAPRGWR